MEIILHIGAHRTASTSFQHYLRQNAQALMRQGLAVWEPRNTRKGTLSGVIPLAWAGPEDRQFKRAKWRVKLRLAAEAKAGARQVIVSDENMLGAPRANLRSERLYAEAGARVERFNAAFDGGAGKIVINIRSQASYWSSVLAFGVTRGHKLPVEADLDRLVTQPRTWRHIVRDVAEAAPGVPIEVVTYEEFGGMPEKKLALATGLTGLPTTHARAWRNRAPDLVEIRAALADRGVAKARWPEGIGRWHPFNAAQTAALEEVYQDDLFWLRAGADGLARLIEEKGVDVSEKDTARKRRERGQPDDIEENRRLA